MYNQWQVGTQNQSSMYPKDVQYIPWQGSGVLPECRCAQQSSSSTGERYEAKSYTKRLQKEPQTLIVGDGAVNKTKHFFSENTKVLCFTNDMVSDISEKILEITAEHPTVKSLVIHTGALDVVKQQSEVLKRDFNDLLNKVRCLNTEVFISGPLPTVRRGDERFSRLLMLNRWLKDTCAAQSVNFIDNFNADTSLRQMHFALTSQE
ncbi:hypothetical protein N1851_026861 [Merluccius polli]|uniref:Uncharacterized protein n=1 Tax=Merluccius polli TaxID=89951 RepID=A0AA47MB29_MERPO|nr:hypothetical protein N1851_026861 [Merluccius polli]